MWTLTWFILMVTFLIKKFKHWNYVFFLHIPLICWFWWIYKLWSLCSVDRCRCWICLLPLLWTILTIWQETLPFLVHIILMNTFAYGLIMIHQPGCNSIKLIICRVYYSCRWPRIRSGQFMSHSFDTTASLLASSTKKASIVSCLFSFLCRSFHHS